MSFEYSSYNYEGSPKEKYISKHQGIPGLDMVQEAQIITRQAAEKLEIPKIKKVTNWLVDKALSSRQNDTIKRRCWETRNSYGANIALREALLMGADWAEADDPNVSSFTSYPENDNYYFIEIVRNRTPYRCFTIDQYSPALENAPSGSPNQTYYFDIRPYSLMTREENHTPDGLSSANIFKLAYEIADGLGIRDSNS